MEPSVSLVDLGLGNPAGAQALAFLGAGLLGSGVGLFYDLLRFFRQGRQSRVLAAALDVLFWCAVTAVMLGYAMWVTGGEVRVYVALAMLGGATAYFLLLSPWVRRVEWALGWFLGKLWDVFTLPFRLLGRGAK